MNEKYMKRFYLWISCILPALGFEVTQTLVGQLTTSLTVSALILTLVSFSCWRLSSATASRHIASSEGTKRCASCSSLSGKCALSKLCAGTNRELPGPVEGGWKRVLTLRARSIHPSSFSGSNSHADHKPD